MSRGPQPVCNIIALTGWRVWDPSPAPTGVAPGIGGSVLVASTTGTELEGSDFWIYDMACAYVSGYLLL